MLQVISIIFLIHSTPLQKGVMYGYRAPLESKVHPSCYIDKYVRAWIYFTDKGVPAQSYNKVLQTVINNMKKASYHRRLLRGGVTDYADIPLYKDYIGEVEARGGILIRESKWLNAASFFITREDIDDIAQLDFVYKITRVASFKNPNDFESVVLDTSLFGLSYQQLNMFNIDELHGQGFFGSDIKIGILDTGLRRKHTALDNVTVVAEHDFLGGDQIYIGNTPITEQVGVYSDITFWKTDTRLNLFAPGDAFDIRPVREIMYTYSTDGGSVWQPMREITNTNNWTRELAVCGRDTMFIFYRDRFGLQYLVYEDTTIDSGPLTGTSNREPSALQIDDTVYVTYHDKNHLYLKKGNISGFMSALIIDSSVSAIKSLKIISSEAEIGIFYHIYPEDSLYFIKSVLPATNFTRDFVALGKDADALAFADTVLLIWKDASHEPLFRIAFSKSVDFGESFSEPQYLSEDLNSIGKISLAKLDGTITVIWETEGKIYFRHSIDYGSTFGVLDSLDKDFVYLPTLGTNGSQILTFYCTRGDSSTDGYASDDPEYNHPRHGTEMLGIIGGYLRDTYIGVAPAAQFLVAKTENRDTLYEFLIEEDTYISGLEWCESMGADIVNSSLGYARWYNWPDDFDGRTSPASIAATEATKRGMVVVSASGNVSVPRIVVPGDAEGVITVGGIDTLFNRWESSGYFPTQDHSVKKPEIVCLSAAPIVVDPDSLNSYLYSFGTSGATAMTTGICALLLEGHPAWNVDSVRSALFETASYADSPSDSMGYGWPDALAAFQYSPSPYDTVAGPLFLTPYPNPFLLSEGSAIYIPFQLDKSYSVELRVYSMNGRLLKEESRGLLLPGRYTGERAFIWDGTDEDNEQVGSGLYYCLLITRGGKNAITKIAVVR